MHLPRSSSCIVCHGVCSDLLSWSLWLCKWWEGTFYQRRSPRGLGLSQDSGGQKGRKAVEGLSESPATSFEGFSSRGSGLTIWWSLFLNPDYLHCPPTGEPSALLSRLKRTKQPFLRNWEYTQARCQGPMLSLPMGSRRWKREGNSQGALPYPAVDRGLLKDETYPIHQAEWSEQRLFEGKGRKTAQSPWGLLSRKRLPSNREIKGSWGWQRAQQ